MRKNPRIALCAAFAAGYEVTKFVLDYDYPIELVATCHKDDSKFEGKIASLARKHKVDVRRSTNVNDADFVRELQKRKIDIVLLAWWPTIVKQEAIAAAYIGWINMHPSWLPYNRGKHPYYWATVEETPFGVTIHFIDTEVDTGRILWQRRIPIGWTDTGESLWQKGYEVILELFKEKYPLIVQGKLRAKTQKSRGATFHLAKELDTHSKIDLNKRYKARDLINIIRGRTFPDGPSAYFIDKGKKYLVRLSIEQKDDLS